MENISHDENDKCLEINPRKKIEVFEDVLPYVGDFGKYQWILTMAMLPFLVAFCTVFYSQIFITLVPQHHWCKINELIDRNLTQDQRIKIAIPQSKQYPYFDKCHHKKLNFQNLSIQEEKMINLGETSQILKCNQWEYNFGQTPYSSISIELNWVCDQEYLISTAHSIFFIGSVLGNFIYGWIADHKGRIVALIVCITTAFIASIGTANTYNFWTFALCRFLMGFAYDSLITIPVIIVVEYADAKKRTLINCLVWGIFFSIGIWTVAWLRYFISDWRLFAYTNSLPFLFCFFVAIMFPESSRWYMSKGMSDKIINKLRRIAVMNGKKPDSWIYTEFIESIMKNKNIESATLFDLIKMPQLTRKTIILAVVFALTTLIMDTHVYFLNRYELSPFMSFTWSGVELIPASLFFFVTVDRWGYRFCGFLGLFLVMVFCYAIVLFESETGKFVAGSLARISITFVLIPLCQYVPAFFPTTVRTQGAALIHFLSVLMHFIAPHTILLANIWRELPMLIMGTLALLNAILILFLPEISGKNLPQTLQDGENLAKTKNSGIFLFSKELKIIK